MKSLQIEQCEDATHLVHGQDQTSQENPILKSLETLIIYHNDNFQEICPGELPEGSFGKLKFFRVQQCLSLVKPLLPSTLIKNLNNLERVEVDGNPVSELFKFDEPRPQSYFLTRLKELKLNNLYRLEHIWNGPVEHAKLNTLFQGLSQLEELYVENCPKLENVIVKDGTEQEAKPFPLLKKLSLISLPMLTSIYGGSETIQWPLLKDKLVKYCDKFSGFQPPQQLPIAADSMLQINIESP
ncbi:uncharacterized protein LOC132805107 [Ziziphus jujuba]|uniref:Uncharacterized protein LOC132805107 n=1 Tax=Ziziphus jujuba TaxID=326968 RepID=A0ABM4AGM8_ZIZJJ|nr:uncharacterized protein LOC132805107 [Ziziphus jujuba]